jgi:hypothetical protein
MKVAENFDYTHFTSIYFSENHAVKEIIVRNTAGSECSIARHRSISMPSKEDKGTNILISLYLTNIF